MAETACPLMRPRSERNPKMATARVPIQRPDTYQRLPRTCKNSLANSSRYIHLGSFQPLVATCSDDCYAGRSCRSNLWFDGQFCTLRDSGEAQLRREPDFRGRKKQVLVNNPKGTLFENQSSVIRSPNGNTHFIQSNVASVSPPGLYSAPIGALYPILRMVPKMWS